MRIAVNNFVVLFVRLRDTFHAYPFPRVASVCAIPGTNQQERYLYECKARGHIFYRHSEPRIRLRGNQRAQSGNSNHGGRRAEAAQLLAGSFTRLLPELRVGVFLWEPPGEGVAGFGLTFSAAFSCTKNAVNSASICGVARSSQSSRTSCSKYAVRSLKYRSSINSAIIFLNTAVSRRLEGDILGTPRLCVCCSAKRKRKTSK